MKVKLLTCTPNAEGIVAAAAKLCYSQVGVDEILESMDQETINKFLDMLLGLGHESPVEHVSFSFAIEGISRITEIQLVRHRIASYSIQSGRYVKRENPEFVMPPSISEFEVAEEIFNDIAEKSARAYNDLFLVLMLKKMNYTSSEVRSFNDDLRVEKVQELYDSNKKLYKKYEKECIEDARYVHLQSISVKLVASMNARSWFNFLKHRDCNRAQWEINRLANKIRSLLIEEAPTLFKYSGASCRKGKCSEGKMCCGSPKC